MPTHKKGQDRDKYYHLAKDQGYRSRAAFKLIQINRRFDFLSKARVCIDLCAAPGGWCQVAAKYMPQGAIVIGVDLLPIRPIRNVKTIVSDITSAECRKLVSAELQGWQADVVLCDGAPNIGSSYSKDAYVQNELVLAALKTATMHLKQGGTFCTKVYRSVDYNALVWVLQQLFQDVQAVKPSSSRSQSSEIFLICLNYTAPTFIDPKLLDPNQVFKEVSKDTDAKVDILHKHHDKHNKRHRGGYGDSVGVLIHKKLKFSEFITSSDPLRALTDYDQFHISDECQNLLKSFELPNVITEYIQDLKLLNKSDVKSLLKWRLSARRALNIEESPSVNKSEKSNGALGSVTDDIVPDIDDELENLGTLAEHNSRRKAKKERQKMRQERERQYLGISNNAFEESRDTEIFNISEAVNLKRLTGMEFEDLDSEIEITSIDDSSVNEKENENADMNYLQVDNSKENFYSRGGSSTETTDLWFSHPIFKETVVSSSHDGDFDFKNEEEYENMMPLSDKAVRKAKRKKLEERKLRKRKLSESKETDYTLEESTNQIDNEYKKKIAAGLGSAVESDHDFEIVKQESIDMEVKDERIYYHNDDNNLDEKISDIALGTLMLNPGKRKALVDSSYNRYTWNDPENLPDWFVEDELRHNKPEIPIPGALIDQVKSRFVDVGSKDIKKVAEARMRKRKRALSKLSAARKKAKAMVDNNEVSSRQKVKVNFIKDIIEIF